MITVSILINSQPLYTRSAFRTEGKQGEVCKYKCDDGSIITHNYNDGADEEIKLEPALDESDNSFEANFIRANLWLFVNFARG